MTKLKTVVAVLALLAAGVALGQSFGSTFILGLSGKALGDSGKTADQIAESYYFKVLDAKSAPQVSQVANEASVHLLYLQARQNAEIIKLLTEIRNKQKP